MVEKVESVKIMLQFIVNRLSVMISVLIDTVVRYRLFCDRDVTANSNPVQQTIRLFCQMQWKYIIYVIHVISNEMWWDKKH